ncbi:hypothetical protein MKK58_12650 [Methylobacterium sp. J-078]|uniref:hypothetical protein n=1 Tax=Methylobacterium sp. J-078 TaxID=2836657 RepID=UPI001FBA6615|nr:hypothetical protein [Methylobacterium sp. J-078]MCJ2045371.1 hypothetical protein [Methylobacterium sp. J-078]
MRTLTKQPLAMSVVERANLFRIGDEVEILRSGGALQFDWGGVTAEVRGLMVDANGRVNIGLRNEWGQVEGAFAPENLRLLRRRSSAHDGVEAEAVSKSE